MATASEPLSPEPRKANQVMTAEGPTMKDRLQSFKTFVWNGEERKLLGRGGRSWAEIGLFYLVYYICLAGFFVGLLAVFYQTLDRDEPKLTGTSSLLKGNPGMGFKPMTDLEYTLIRFRKSPKSYEPHVKSIDKALKPYLDAEAANDTEKVGVVCTDDALPGPGQVCRFNTSALTSRCNPDNDYGYGVDKQPCVLLRLNKIFGWMPEKYTADNVHSSGASPALQEKILANPNMIYIDCRGENPADRDYMGRVEYYPQQGFPHYYYPYRGQAGYVSPLVFVKFLDLPSNMGLMLECRALAPNIRYDRQEKEGGVNFEMLMDP